MIEHRQLVRSISRWGWVAIGVGVLLAAASLGVPELVGAQGGNAQAIVVKRYADAAPPTPTAISLVSSTLSWTPGAETGQVFCMPNCVQHVTVGRTIWYIIHSRPTDGSAGWQRTGFVNGQNGNPPPATYTITQTGHEYRVRACNMDGRELRCSGWSPVVSGTTAGATVGGVGVQ